MTTATVTTTSEINDLIGRIKKNDRGARAARFLLQCFDLVGQQRRDMFIFEVLTTTQTRSSKSFILFLCVKAIRAEQAKVHLIYFVRRDQHGIIPKQLPQCKVLF